MSGVPLSPEKGAATGGFAIRHRLAIIFITIAVCLGGVFCAMKMPSSVFPETEFPRCVILAACCRRDLSQVDPESYFSKRSFSRERGNRHSWICESSRVQHRQKSFVAGGMRRRVAKLFSTRPLADRAPVHAQSAGKHGRKISCIAESKSGGRRASDSFPATHDQSRGRAV